MSAAFLPARLFRPRPIVVALAAAIGLAVAMPAAAMTMGVPRLNSGLGQPLDLVIPVQTDNPDELSTQCVRLLPAPDADTPTLSVGRLQIERDGVLSSVRIRSAEPINEPALRVILEAGCQRRMQREYILLIDPPMLRLSPPATATATTPSFGNLPAAPPASIEFGTAEIRAVRGRPLQLRVPLRGADAARLAPDCVRSLDDGLMPPALANGRARLLDAGSASPTLEITGRDPLNDRSVRVIAEVGCERPLRREFDVLVEPAPIAFEGAPQAAPAPRRPAAERPPRPRPPAVAAAPAAPTQPTVAPPAPRLPAAEPAPTAPAPAAAAAAKPSDRLVLSSPDDLPKATPDNPTPAPTQTDELARQIAALATEVKRLRTELDAANQRNAVLSEKLARSDSSSIGWAVAAGVAALLAAMMWLGNRRRRNASQPAASEYGEEGPMTRIVGRRTREGQRVAPAAAVPPQGATLMTAALTDVRTQEPGASIQVTEMGDEEAIRELYADFVSKQNPPGSTLRFDMPAQPAGRYEAGKSLDASTHFGDDVPATRLTVPATTQIAVDIDLSQDTDPATRTHVPVRSDHASAPTQPMTRPLELDLELDLPAHAKPRGGKSG